MNIIQHIKWKDWIFITLLTLAIIGCAKKVVKYEPIPPAVDLRNYEKIALIEFASNSEGELHKLVTQKFLQRVQYLQPGVRVIEVGDRDKVLTSLALKELDYEAIQAIGKKYGVDAVITGNLDISDIKPDYKISASHSIENLIEQTINNIQRVNISAELNARLTGKLLEVGGGATAWTRSAAGAWKVAAIDIDSHGQARFNARNPEATYGNMSNWLVKNLSIDFQSGSLKKVYRVTENGLVQIR
ncbi:hypothetical protein [Kaarinaea lacus]